MTLDVGVWDASVMSLFEKTGNGFVNSLMEKRMRDYHDKHQEWLWSASDDETSGGVGGVGGVGVGGGGGAGGGAGEGMASTPNTDATGPPSPNLGTIQRKPNPQDALPTKEAFIRAKYVDRAFANTHAWEGEGERKGKGKGKGETRGMRF